jgi:glycosyltransferase involved in cell wall biosynthesis
MGGTAEAVERNGFTAAAKAGERLIVGLNLFESVEWMGGTIYIQNLMRALAALPSEERPCVRLLGMLRRSSALVQELIGLDFVEYSPGQLKGEHTVVGNTLYRLRRYAGRNVPFLGDPETRGLDAVYPALAASRNEHADIYWIPDFQSEYFPHLFTAEEIELRRTRYRAIAAQRGTLVLSSQAALDDFNRFYPGATVNTRIWRFCTTVSLNEQGRDPRDAYGVPEKYLYLPNQFWAHKDHRTAFAALQLIADRGGFDDVRIVCTGFQNDSRNDGYVQELQRFIAETGIGDRILFLGLVPRADQIEIFRRAAAVLQPSLFEGWSTVVEDAKAIGRPVILSDLPVHVEQAPADGVYFKRSSPEDLSRVIADVWPRLRPGPDLERERAAAARTAARRLAAAREFVEIVREAVGMRCASRR